MTEKLLTGTLSLNTTNQPCKQGLDTVLCRAVLLYTLQTSARHHPRQSCSIILPANKGSTPSCAELFYYTPCKQGLDTILRRAVIRPANGLDKILRRTVLLYSLQTRAQYNPAQSCSIIFPANKGSTPSCVELFYYTPCKQGLDTILRRAVLLYTLQTAAQYHPAQSCSVILPANKGSTPSCAAVLLYSLQTRD